MKADSIEFDRRRFLKTASAGTSAMLIAGCASQEGGSGGGSGGSSMFHMPTDNDYSDLNFNPYNGNPENGVGSTSLFYEPLIMYHQGKQKHIGMLAKDWKLDGKTFTLTLRKGYTWGDGTPLTSHDIRVQTELESFIFQSDTFNSYETPDKHTLKLTVDSINPKLVTSQIPTLAQAKAKIFEKYLKQFRNAKNDDEQEKVRTKLLQDVTITEPYSSGPWKITKTSEQRIIGKLRDDHPRAKNVNTDTIQSESFSSQNSIAQAAVSGNVDTTAGQLPETTIEQMTSKSWKWIKIPVPVGGMNAFSPKSSFFGVEDDSNEYKVGHRKERQAIAYLLDLDKLDKLGGKPVGKPKWQTAMAQQPNQKYLTDEMKSNMIDYGRGANPEKAAQLMRDAGYEKKSGTWKKNGKPVKLQYKYPSGWQESSIWQASTQMLNEFGIKTNSAGIENTTFFSKTVPNHDFDTGFVGIWIATPDGYPYYGFYNNLGSLSTPKTDYNNEVSKIKAPPLNEPNGTPKPFDFDEKTKRLGKTSDKSEATQIIREVAWAVNWWMPFVQMFQKKDYHFINTNNFELTVSPDSDEVQIGDLLAYLTRKGELKAK